MPDNYENNGNLAAAIAGIALATEVDDSFNNDTDNSTELEVEDSLNDNSDNSTEVEVEVEIEDSLNDYSDSSTDFAVNDSLNDSSDNSTDLDVDIEDSFQDNTDNSTNLDVALSDSFNDNSTDDDINNSLNDNSTDVDVEIKDSFTTDDSINDSFNTDFSLDVAVSDSFNTSDTDWLDLDNVSFDAMTNITDSLNGNGNDTAFSVHQINEMADNDSLHHAEVVSNAGWGQHADADGGGAYGIKAYDDVENGSGDHQSVSSSADASATSGNEAFTQNIVMGANIQYNSVSSTIVGGDSDISSADDMA